eukprot:574027-Prymnesium_polylepis.1
MEHGVEFEVCADCASSAAFSSGCVSRPFLKFPAPNPASTSQAFVFSNKSDILDMCAPTVLQ